jgi:hypothetical protein
MSTSPLLALRGHIAALTSASDLQPVADALHAGRSSFDGAPASILDLWTIDSQLHGWQARMEQGPLGAEDTARMLADVDAGWQGVAALLAGGVVRA